MVLSIFNRKKNILYKFVPKHIFQVITDDIESKLAIKNILKDFTILSSKQHPSRAAGRKTIVVKTQNSFYKKGGRNVQAK